MNSFGMRLKSLRQKNFITQDELAMQLEQLGCNATSKCAISQYENNKRLPDIRTLSMIAEFFNVSVDYLLGNEVTDDGEIKILSLFKKLDEKGKAMLTAYATALYDSELRQNA